MALRTLSLCAGIGGIDLGLERIGAARAVCYVEREAFPAACLVAAMQRGELAEAPVWSDLRTFDARAWRGAVDLVVGGYPCQPFSFAGARRGADDERHLWPEVLRIFRDSGARLLFCENVAGHLSLGFTDVLADLAALGCDVEWDLFRASDVGAPHKRERLFFLAHRDLDGLEEFGRSGLLDRERAALGNDAHGCGAHVADATRIGHERGGSARRWRHGLEDGEFVVEHASSERRREGRTESEFRRGRSAVGIPGFPPRPDDVDGWRRWIDEGGPLPTVRRSADGLSSRLDQLRSLGNAVVPQCAALAFTELARRVT